MRHIKLTFEQVEFLLQAPGRSRCAVRMANYSDISRHPMNAPSSSGRNGAAIPRGEAIRPLSVRGDSATPYHPESRRAILRRGEYFRSISTERGSGDFRRDVCHQASDQPGFLATSSVLTTP